MAITKVYLTQYSASVDDSPVLLLGTKESYGIEQLQIIRSPEWEDLIITATFAAGDTPLASPVLVPEDGLIDVPAGATAERLPLEACGVITFCGVADGVQRISTSIPYLVSDHGPIEGTAPEPTPSEWEQLVAEYQKRLDKSVPPDGMPGYVLGATENGNAWVPQTGGGGGYGGTITDEDNGVVYDAAVHIRDGFPVLILTERSTTNG